MGIHLKITHRVEGLLKNITFIVKLGGHFSIEGILKSSVLQGSVLGPLLFLIFCIVSLRIASSTLKTTGVRLMSLDRFGTAVRGALATGVTMAWCQSSGMWNILEGDVKDAGKGRG